MPYISTPKGKLYYQLKGNESATITIGFMNGVMASASSWTLYEEFFNKLGYRTVSFDFIGQLMSDKPEGPYTFDQHVLEAKHLYDYLNIDQLHLVGTSYGSEVAMKFTMTFPNMVKSLTIIDGTAQINPQMKETILKWHRDTYLDGEQFFLNMMNDIYHPDYIKRNELDLLNRAQKLNGQTEYLRGQRILYETFLNEVHFLDELKQINTPTLVIVGLQDTLKTPQDSMNIHKQIKNSEYVLFDDCGHVTIFEKPEELKTTLLGFISKVESLS